MRLVLLVSILSLVRSENTPGMTDTEFARNDAADAVHYKYNVTRMETHMLLNVIC